MVRSLVAALSVLLLAATSVSASGYPGVAGWSAANPKEGIRGYIRQPTDGIKVDAVASWIGLCDDDCANQNYVIGGAGPVWVQLGLVQGDWRGGSARSAVQMYYENVDPCGDYYSEPLGVPPSQPYFFVVKYDGSGIQHLDCPDGTPYLGYMFAFKKGSSANNPFFVGSMNSTMGRADAETEVDSGATQPTTNFGCQDFAQCDNSAYGIETKNSTGWHLCCTNATSKPSSGPDDPPWRYTYHEYWAFKTCQSQAACQP